MLLSLLLFARMESARSGGWEITTFGKGDIDKTEKAIFDADSVSGIECQYTDSVSGGKMTDYPTIWIPTESESFSILAFSFFGSPAGLPPAGTPKGEKPLAN